MSTLTSQLLNAEVFQISKFSLLHENLFLARCFDQVLESNIESPENRGFRWQRGMSGLFFIVQIFYIRFASFEVVPKEI